MRRRLTSLFVSLLACLFVGPVVAASAAPAAVSSAATGSTDGFDPAERDAVDGTLGYHEKRGYPYGLLVFLVVMTPVALVAIRRWTPKIEDGSE
jgi:hypothetical protein